NKQHLFANSLPIETRRNAMKIRPLSTSALPFGLVRHAISTVLLLGCSQFAMADGPLRGNPVDAVPTPELPAPPPSTPLQTPAPPPSAVQGRAAMQIKIGRAHV